jgi:hypothetical protein
MLTDICVDAVLAIKPEEDKAAVDLHMIELMEMQHRAEQVLGSLTREKNSFLRNSRIHLSVTN